MSALPLQGEISLDDYTNPGADLLAEVLADLVAGAGSEAIFGVLVGGVLILSLWLAGDGDLATPSVMTVLVGGVLFPVLPGTYLGIARAVTFLGLVGAILAAVEKYYLEGAQ